MKNYNFSIIVPTYNRYEELFKSLDSLEKQTYKNFEVIVFDDGSTDNTFEVISYYKKKLNLIYFRQENSGKPAIVRNKAIKKSNNEYIAFLDSDDWWDKDKLLIANRYINMYPKSIYYTDTVCVGKDKKGSFSMKNHNSKTINNFCSFKDLIINGNTITTSSCVVYKKHIYKVNLFNIDDQYIAWEDYDLWLRMSLLKVKFIHIKRPLTFYYHSPKSITNSKRIIKIQKAIKEVWFDNDKYSFNKFSIYPPSWYYANIILYSNLREIKKTFINYFYFLGSCFIYLNFTFLLKSNYRILIFFKIIFN